MKVWPGQPHLVLPAHQIKVRWDLVLDTREATGQWRYCLLQGGEAYELETRSLALFRLQRST
jgi:hypothetical protein